MYYEQGWWVNIARDLDLRYIIINKELVANGVGGHRNTCARWSGSSSLKWIGAVNM